MKRQTTRKTADRAVSAKKRIGRPKRKVGAARLAQSAQMPDYLLEEHPEFGK
jgi:hypothetical protein